jgi:hypothetical protein
MIYAAGDSRRSSFTPLPDEKPAAGGGVMRRIAPKGAGIGSALASAFEIMFSPNRPQAREEVERQRRTSKPKASPTDPPGDLGLDDDGEVDDGEVDRLRYEPPAAGLVVQGRPGTPFSGRVVLRREPPASAS